MRYGGLIAAIVFAAVAAVVVLQMSGGSPAPSAPGAPQNVEGVQIFVAATTIPVGSAITQEMVTTQAWPKHLAMEGFLRADSKENPVVGMVARAPFQQGEPIINSKLANPNDPNFLAGDLPKGMRVVSIPLNEVDGVAGFVFPGDHVDLIYTHDVEVVVDDTLSNSGVRRKDKRTFTETLLTNVKVLAVDQRSSNVGATDNKGKLIVPKSASVMVSQADAQRVRLAQKTGTVSLALRALADKEVADPLILTSAKDISQAAGEDVASGEGVKLVRGAPDKQTETVSVVGVKRGAAVQTTTETSPATVTKQGAP